MRTEKWCDHDVRFVEVDGKQWVVLIDICDVLHLDFDSVLEYLNDPLIYGENTNVRYFELLDFTGYLVTDLGILEIVFDYDYSKSSAFRIRAYNDTRRIFG